MEASTSAGPGSQAGAGSEPAAGAGASEVGVPAGQQPVASEQQRAVAAAAAGGGEEGLACCANCGATTTKLKKCSACQAVRCARAVISFHVFLRLNCSRTCPLRAIWAGSHAALHFSRSTPPLCHAAASIYSQDNISFPCPACAATAAWIAKRLTGRGGTTPTATSCAT